MKPEECIFHLLGKAARSGTRCWKQATADLGITAVQGKALNFLHAYGEVTAGELGELICLDSATLTGLLDRLETMALVERVAKLDDRRAIIIRLTEKGSHLAEAANSRMKPANQQFLEHFTPAETAMLREFLQRL